MWYAYEGENDLIAVKAEDVKAIIDMNRQQQYPERLEDYQVELMSTSALAQESTGEEVEREMLRLAEGGNGVVGDVVQEGPSERDHRPQRDRRGHGDQPRGDRPQRGDRQPRGDRQSRGDRPQRSEQRQNPEQRQDADRPKRNNNNGGKQRRDGGDAPRRSGGRENRDRRG